MRLFVDSQLVSPYAISVYVGLLEKGLTFDLEQIDLSAKANLATAFAATSLTRRIPTLVHEDFALSESSAICEYLDETFPGTALYPADPRLRARARQIQAWLRSDLVPIREERSTLVVFCGAKRSPLSPDARTAADKLFAAAHAVLKGRSDHLFDQWCIAYASQQWQRPSVQDWVNKMRPNLRVVA